MKTRKHLKSMIAPVQALFLLVFVLATFVTCNVNLATTIPSHNRAKLWGLIPSIDSNIPKHIIVMGSPASGKGTQCSRLSEKYGLVHISSGDLLRQAVASSEGGQMPPHIATIKECMDTGKLIPDSLMTRIILERLRSRDCQERGYILDGYPRTVAQARSLQDAGIRPDAFLLLNVSDEEAIRRVVGRRIDSLTGKVYHLEFNPPPKNDIEIQKRLIIRSDDTVESMRIRLKQFKKNVASVEDWYRDIKYEIDGASAPSVVSREIDATLKQMRKRKQRAL